MMAVGVKRARPPLEHIDNIPLGAKKHFYMRLLTKGESTPLRKTRRKIGMEDLLLSRRQYEYSIA